MSHLINSSAIRYFIYHKMYWRENVPADTGGMKNETSYLLRNQTI